MAEVFDTAPVASVQSKYQKIEAPLITPSVIEGSELWVLGLVLGLRDQVKTTSINNHLLSFVGNKGVLLLHGR